MKIRFSQTHKSFPIKYEVDLDGNLIILSGVNGSGKSHLLQAINISTIVDLRTEIGI